MANATGLFGAAVLAFQLTGGIAWGMASGQPGTPDLPVPRPLIEVSRHGTTAQRLASGADASGRSARPSAIPNEPSPMPRSELPTLTSQQEQVSRSAQSRGDTTFLMVDKTQGRILLFRNGGLVFTGAALTGASTADQFPPNELHEKFSRLNGLEYKVTPAGRFTVSRGYDPDYGALLDINEIRGKDWGIAIHKVYLGTPSEHRDLRLRSEATEARSITFGCINVAPETIRWLLRELPAREPTPLYILPHDEARTAMYFAPRMARNETLSPESTDREH